MGDSNGDEDGGGVDGDGSGGNSPSRQGARTETSVPRTSSATAAALQNFIWENTNSFRVFPSEAFYRRMGDVRGHQGAHTRWWRSQGWTRATRWCGHLLAHLRLVSEKIGNSGFVSSNSENISRVTFLKHKNRRKQELAGILLIG
jgi:hypothetical protein